MSDIWNPAVVDAPSTPGRHVREPHRAGAPAAPPTAAARARPTGASQRRAGRPRRHRGPGHDPAHLDDVPAGPARAACAALFLEVFYDGADEPSVSVPCLDFFGLPHGRPVAYDSALTSAQEGRGFNSYLPMPFGQQRPHRARQRGAERGAPLLPGRLHAEPDDARRVGYLHVTFRRENPTVLRDDFVIADGLAWPGPVPRLQRRHQGHRRRRLVRRRRGEDLPRRRHRSADDLRHRTRGLHRQCVGARPAPRSLRRRAGDRLAQPGHHAAERIRRGADFVELLPLAHRPIPSCSRATAR